MKQIYFSGDYVLKGFKIGVVAGMIALTVRQSTTFIYCLYQENLVINQSNDFIHLFSWNGFNRKL